MYPCGIVEDIINKVDKIFNCFPCFPVPSERSKRPRNLAKSPPTLSQTLRIKAVCPRHVRKKLFPEKTNSYQTSNPSPCYAFVEKSNKETKNTIRGARKSTTPFVFVRRRAISLPHVPCRHVPVLRRGPIQVPAPKADPEGSSFPKAPRIQGWFLNSHLLFP
jgi:hypothetical protein